MSARQAVAAAAAQFAAFSSTPRLDAELLMAHAMEISRERLLLACLDDPAPADFAALVARRLSHEPIAYITGTRAFWTIELAVGPGVLVPRADSETLIEAALAHFGAAGPATILDLGTGPGTLLLAALDQWLDAMGLGVDRSAEAIVMACANALRLGMETRARFVLGDWAGAIDAPFGLVLANPPYIATADPLPTEVRDHEPAAALFAGHDGMDAYRRILPDLRRLIAPGGIGAVEIGAGQASAVTALARVHGFEVVPRTDLAGHVRALLLR